MKLYDSIGPNPHIVRMVAAEKGIDLARTTVDMRSGENRQPAYLAKNPAGTTPCLELPDGTFISEVTVIADYLEELYPLPAVIGETAVERAETRMWTRRIDLGVVEPLLNGFRAGPGRRMFATRVKLVREEAAPDLTAIAVDRLLWLDGQLHDRTWVCGDRFTLADITLWCTLAFARTAGFPLPGEATWLPGWFDRVAARPSATA